MNPMIALAVLALTAGPALGQTTPAKPRGKTRGVRIIPAQEAPPAPTASALTAPADARQSPPILPVSPVEDRLPGPTAPAGSCDRAIVANDLTFMDAPDFDVRLRGLLASPTGVSRVVDVPGFRPDAAPARLQPWLAEVQRTGGKVSTREIRCTRTRGFSLLKLLSKLFKPAPETLYAAAKDWDAVLWTEAATGQVRQVQFTRRSPSAG